MIRLKTETDASVRAMLIIILVSAVMLSAIVLAMAQMPGGMAAVYDKISSSLNQPKPGPAPEAESAPTPSPSPAPTHVPTPEPTADPEVLAYNELKARQDSEKEFLILVNPWHYIPEDYSPELIMIEDENEQEIDVRCYDELMRMLTDCREAGNAPFLCSGYRTWDYQQELFDNKILRVIKSGYSAEEAPAIAARSVAVPGTSEHQLGLAADIIDYYDPDLNETQEQTSTQQWLMLHSWEYGFILRYPNGTTDITGIIYEPWHYRYVGHIAAEEIYNRGITLEEYLEYLYPGEQ